MPTVIEDLGDLSTSQVSDGPGSTASITIECICSPAVVHRNANAISCVYCSQPVLLACLLHKYAQSGGALRNSVEWLQGFVASCGLVFICHTCQTKPHGLHVVAESTMVLPRNFPAEELHAGGILPRASTDSKRRLSKC